MITWFTRRPGSRYPPAECGHPNPHSAGESTNGISMNSLGNDLARCSYGAADESQARPPLTSSVLLAATVGASESTVSDASSALKCRGLILKPLPRLFANSHPPAMALKD
jgi:hypothetical protein